MIQIKLREERGARRATMDGRHEYILTTVADCLRMTIDDAEEFMLDGDCVSGYMVNFAVSACSNSFTMYLLEA